MRNLSFIFLNFEATGERVPFARLKERTEDDDERERIELMRAMREEGMTYQQIADELGYKSHTTVMSALKRLG